MGLFNGYTKPGPGIDKNEPKKRGIFRFFEILGRKLTKLMGVNMLYFICSLPVLLICYFLGAPVISAVTQKVFSTEATATLSGIMMFGTMISFMFCICYLVFIGSGPASAANAYIMKEFINEEHVWIVSTFFSKFKENFKQGIIVSIADIIYMIFSSVAFIFYYTKYVQTQNTVWFFLVVFLMILSFIYVCMHFYIYQLMITFENTIPNLFKNAFILAITTMPVNIILLAIDFLIIFMIFNFFNPVVSLILGFLIVVNLTRFVLEFYAQSIIKKRILDNILAKEEKQEEIFGSDN